jgi:hypothetical protein
MPTGANALLVLGAISEAERKRVETKTFRPIFMSARTPLSAACRA